MYHKSRSRGRVVRKGRKPSRRLGGAGLWKWLKKASSWLKKHKVISTVGNALGSAGVPYAGTIGKAAGVMGLGRRKTKGGSLGLAGGRRRTVRRRRR